MNKKQIVQVCAPLIIYAMGSQLIGCSTLPPVKKGEYSPSDLLGFACSSGRNIVEARGRILAKVSSRDLSGQFQASVVVNSADHLELDVTNPLGGSQALIKIDRGQIEIVDFSGNNETRQKGQEYWGGIPLRWASDLFLGRIPCPPKSSSLKLEVGKDGELIAILGSSKDDAHQKFIYQFSQWNHQPWPTSLTWSREGLKSAQVDFIFDSPEKETGSPEKWEARSSQGQIKMKWRTREISRD